MPCLELVTNVRIPDQDRLMRRLSQTVCTGLGKSEIYMMVILRGETPMYFSGNVEPTAFLHVKTLGLRPEAIKGLTPGLADLVYQELGVDRSRIYTLFSDADPTNWAQGGQTFG